ncbi:MAG: HlyC/CorC family transporter [Acidimicrobiia bacterium]|nr:HlyC/CorC family transporter [Acidimicrobiia bacterium]
MTTSDILLLVLVVGLVAVAALLAMAETSLTHLPVARAKALEEEGRRGAGLLRHLLERREKVLNPVLLLVLVCHLSAAALVALLANEEFGAPGIALAVLGLAIVIFVAAEAAPKTYALQHPEGAALLVAPLVTVLARTLPVRLVTRALIALSNLILPGKGRKAGPVVSEEELLAMADVALEEEVIEVEERRLIHSIIDFGDTVAREVMVPRPDMVTVPADMPVEQALATALDRGVTRVPAYGAEGIDDIVGTLHARDLTRATLEGLGTMPARSLLRTARYVPETKRVAELMREMQAETFHLAIVVDEYGSTAGLVTLEDLIEELVGEIVDEFDVETPRVEPLPGGDVRIDARMPVDEVNELLGVALPTGDWDTLGGLVFSKLGHVPAEDEVVEVDGHRLRAEQVEGRRIGRVRIAARGLNGSEAQTAEATDR